MTTSVQERLRHVLGFSLYCLAVVWSLIEVRYPISGVPYLLFAAAFAVTMTYWCIVDSRVAGRPILHSFYWLIFLLWPIAVPIYLIWARGLRGLGFALLHAIGLLGVSFIAYQVTGYLIYGNLWFSPPQ